MQRLDRQIRPDQRGQRVSVQGQGPLDGGAGQRRQPEQGAVRPDLGAEAGRARRPGDVSATADATPAAEDWTYDKMLQVAEACQKDRQDVRHRSGRHRRFGGHGRLDVRRVRRRGRQRQGRHHGEVRRGAPGAGIRPEAGQVPAGRRGQLRRCVEQPRADLGQERADLESAFGLGGGEARRAEGCRRLLDVPGAEGPEGPLRAAGRVLLGRVELRAEQVGGEGTDRVPVAAREAWRRGAMRRWATTCRRSPA